MKSEEFFRASFFILHFSLNFAKQNSFGRAASRRVPRHSRRAIRSITRTAFHAVAGGSATIPLAKMHFRPPPDSYFNSATTKNKSRLFSRIRRDF